MDDSVKNISGDHASAETGRQENERSARIKRMRGWMGIKSAVETHNLGGGGESLIEVDAPNGWNR
ncbi:MAG: hypothetical protein MJY87_00405 [Fibrobacter sp.]|nr:hypothetical protein [Fibrobacter sp.]